MRSRFLRRSECTLGSQVAAASDEERDGTNSQQSQSRGFRHGQGFALEGQIPNVSTQPRGKGASHSARRVFIDVAAALIDHKQVACAVKGYSVRMSQPGGKGASHSARRKIIDVAAAVIRHKQNTRAVE